MAKSYFYSANGINTPYFGCIVGQKNNYRTYNYELHLFKEDIIAGINVQEWINFISTFNLKVDLEEQADKWICKFTPEYYNNVGHFMAAFTSVRYMLKSHIWHSSYSDYLEPIVSNTLSFKKQFPEFDEVNCFKLGHYIIYDDYNYIADALHTLIESVTTFISNEEFIANTSKHKIGNHMFNGHKVISSFKNIYDLYLNGEINKILTLLYDKNN